MLSVPEPAHDDGIDILWSLLHHVLREFLDRGDQGLIANKIGDFHVDYSRLLGTKYLPWSAYLEIFLRDNKTIITVT